MILSPILGAPSPSRGSQGGRGQGLIGLPSKPTEYLQYVSVRFEAHVYMHVFRSHACATPTPPWPSRTASCCFTSRAISCAAEQLLPLLQARFSPYPADSWHATLRSYLSLPRRLFRCPSGCRGRGFPSPHDARKGRVPGLDRIIKMRMGCVECGSMISIYRGWPWSVTSWKVFGTRFACLSHKT